MNIFSSFVYVAMIIFMVQGVQGQGGNDATSGKCIRSREGFYLSFEQNDRYGTSSLWYTPRFGWLSGSSECSDNEKWDVVQMTGGYYEIRHVLCSTSDIKCVLVYPLEVVPKDIDEKTSYREGTQWRQKFHDDGSFSFITRDNKYSDAFMLSFDSWGVGTYNTDYYRANDKTSFSLVD